MNASNATERDESLASHGEPDCSAPIDEPLAARTLSEPSQPESSTAASDAQRVRPSDAERVGPASQTLVASASSSAPVADRRADGKFAPGNTAAMTHGARRSLDRPDAIAGIAEKRAAVAAYVGADATDTIPQDLITDYARLDVLIETVAANIEANGMFTTKGNKRAAVSLLQSLMDRRLRLATALGIERKAKPVKSVSDIMREHEATK